MKIFIDTKTWVIVKEERESPFLIGENFNGNVKIYFNEQPVTFFPTLDVVKSNGRKRGPFGYDTSGYGSEVIEDIIWYYFNFTLSAINGVIDTPGEILITCSINFTNDSGIITGKRVVNIKNNVVKTAIYGDGNVIVMGEDAESILLDAARNITKEQAKVTNLDVRVTELEEKQQDIINGDLSVGNADRAFSDYFGNVFTEHYETKIGATGKVNALKQKVENGEVIGYGSHRDGVGNNIVQTYERKEDATNKLNNLRATIPTKLSDLINDSGFITNIVDNLTNYYTKQQTYTQDEVRTLIKGVSTLDIRVVSILPTENISNTTIYLLSTTATEENNVYEEYIYANNRWELLGNTKVDLSEYAKTSQLPTKVSDLTQDVNYALKDELPTNFITNAFAEMHYVSKEFELDLNPTILTGGKWVFTGNPVNSNVGTLSGPRIKDAFGNVFYTILIFDGKIKYKVPNSENWAEIYNPISKTGLAYKDGVLNEDYFIEFTDDTYFEKIYSAFNTDMIAKKYVPIEDVKKEELPTKTSDLINDSGFITKDDIPSQQVIKKGGTVALQTASWKIANPYFMDFEPMYNADFAFSDSDGNSFFGIHITKGGAVGEEYLIFKGLKLVNGYTQQFIILNNSNRDINVFNGIAVDGDKLRDDYYLTFTQHDEEIYNIIKNLCVPFEYKTDTSDIIFATPEYVNKVKHEVKNLIKGVSALDIKVVSTLPTENISNTTIYLVATTATEENNVYEEYIYANNRWELLGNTKIDLSEYAKTSQLPTKTSQLENDSNYVNQSYFENAVNLFEEEVDKLNGKIDKVKLDAIIDIDSVDEIGGEPTAVPEDGFVKKVYFNNSLSLEETLTIIDSLNFVPFEEGIQIWACLTDSTMETNVIGIMKLIEDESYEYQIMSVSNGIPMGYNSIIFSWNSALGVSDTQNFNENGWVKGFNGVIEFNIANLLSVAAPALNFTPENDKAIQLFSIRPFANSKEQVIYRTTTYKEGIAVPDSGYVDKIYVNTNLPVDYVTQILKGVPYHNAFNGNIGTEYSVFSDETRNNRIMLGWMLAYFIGYNGTILFSSIAMPELDISFTGWNPEFNGIIELGFEGANQLHDSFSNSYFPVGNYNTGLTELFSLTPFEVEKTELYHVKNKTVCKIGDGYIKDEIDVLLDSKVDKVEGKQLSTNDYTNADKTKLDNFNFTKGIPSEHNILGGIWVAELNKDYTIWEKAGYTGSTTKIYDTKIVDSLGNSFTQLKWTLSMNSKTMSYTGIKKDGTEVLIFRTGTYSVLEGLATKSYTSVNTNYWIRFLSYPTATDYSWDNSIIEHSFTKTASSVTELNVDELYLYTGKVATESFVEEKINELNSSGNSGNTSGGLYIHNIHLKYFDTVEYMEYIIELSVYSSKSSAFQSYEEFIAIYNNTIHSGIFSGSTAQTPEGSNAVVRFIDNHVQTVAIIPNSMSFAPEQCYSFNSVNHQDADFEFTDTVIPV